MALQKITMLDKNVERVINDMFRELYERTAYSTTLKTFKEEYKNATTDAERLAVVAEYIKLT